MLASKDDDRKNCGEQEAFHSSLVQARKIIHFDKKCNLAARSEIVFSQAFWGKLTHSFNSRSL